MYLYISTQYTAENIRWMREKRVVSLACDVGVMVNSVLILSPSRYCTTTTTTTNSTRCAQSWRYKPGQYIAGVSGCGPPALPYARA